MGTDVPRGAWTPWRGLVALALLVGAAVHFLLPGTVWVPVAFIGVLSGAAVYSWVTGLRAPPGRRLPSLLVGAGLTCNALGELVWYVAVVDNEFTDVSLADVGWLTTYPLLAAALWVTLVRSQRDGRADHTTVVDALTIITVSVLVLWNLSVEAIAGDPSLTPAIQLVWSMYPITDAVLLALTIRILTNRRARAAVNGWFSVGVVSWLTADLGFLMLPLTDLNEAWENTGWMLGAVLMAGALHPRAARTARPVEEDHATEHESTRTKLMIATVPLLVPAGLVLLDEVRGLELDSTQLVVGLLILIGLAYLRTSRLLESEKQAQLELAEARDAALAASRAKSAFLATMSHEIRTPMNGVIGLTGLLLASELDDRQRQQAEGVRTAGESLLAIINDILDFSKVEAGHLDLESLDLDLTKVVEEAALIVTDPAHRKSLELLAYCSPELPTRLVGDPSRLRQVLVNLISNAVKFTESGEVVVRAELADRTDDGVVVRFAVRDTGVGVDPAAVDRLFDPFTQADSSTTRQYGGTGLGLAICRQLVTAMGGEIGVESSPGEGSTFWFTVPLGLAEDAAPEPVRSGDAMAGARVLVVDDNETHREILAEQLVAWDLVVDAAEDAATALARLEDAADAGAPYRLVVTDYLMPGMDGLQLASVVTHGLDVGRPALVLLSASPDVSVEEARSAGIRSVLGKPVRRALLQAALDEALGTAPATPSRSGPLPSPGGHGHVLVVDDSEINQVVAVGMLERLGFTTEVAADGREAVAAVERTRFAAVLMDCRMPVMDGFEATRTIRRLEGEEPRTPVIALTAGASEDDRRACLDAGMDDFLAKPVDLDLLDRTLRRWVPTTAPVGS